MQTKQLGSTGLHLSVIGFGSFALGGKDWKFSWGPQDDEDSVKTMVRAVELGVNWIDTAPVYGFGHAEEVVARALKKMKRKPLIATKCGRVPAGGGNIKGCLRKESVLREADDSLRRLQVDVIDLYQMHWPQPEEEIEEGWDAMVRVLKAGKARYLGVSNFNVAQMERVRPIHPIASLQPPYSMLRREIEPEVLPYCAKHNIGVIAYSPLAKGLLTGAFTPERVKNLPPEDHRKTSDPNFAEPNLGANLQLVEGLGRLARAAGLTLSELALAWVLRRPEMTAAIVGGRRPKQIEETAPAAGKTLTPAILQEIEGLLEERQKMIS